MRKLDSIKSDSAHYSIFEIESIDEVKHLFFSDFQGNPVSQPRVDEMNFLLIGTDGVHGTGKTIDELEQEWDNEDYGHSLTMLIVHPRLVCLKFGDIEVNREDIPWLREVSKLSLKAVKEIFKGNL